MDITIERVEYEYIPEWNDNKEDPKPAKVTIKLLTASERDSCLEYETVDGELAVKPNMQRFVTYGVSAIENLTVNGKEILSGKMLCRTVGLDGLYSELATEVVRSNTKADLKNS